MATAVNRSGLLQWKLGYSTKRHSIELKRLAWVQLDWIILRCTLAQDAIIRDAPRFLARIIALIAWFNLKYGNSNIASRYEAAPEHGETATPRCILHNVSVVSPSLRLFYKVNYSVFDWQEILVEPVVSFVLKRLIPKPKAVELYALRWN
jgi:hypothetical protein